MRVLGLALIAVGLTVICGALILRLRTSMTAEEEKTESHEEVETGMADLLRRLNESDEDPSR
jgi:hypothetical protein